MALDVTSVPPWKLAILERKKRQEEEEKVKKTEELSRFSQMPSWKRDILLKKQSKTVNGKTVCYDAVDVCNNTTLSDERTLLGPVSVNVGLESAPEKKLSPLCPTAEFDYTVLSKEEENQEHLLPIQENFWFKSDQRKHSVPSGPQGHVNNKSAPPLAQEQANNSSPNSSGVISLNSSAEFESVTPTTPTPVTSRDNVEDDVFTNGEEVAYGRGFVNKLLKKFKHLSSPDDRNTLPRKSSSPFAKRNHSADTLLDSPSPSKQDNRASWAGGYGTLDRYERLHSSPGLSSKERAHSMDNLLSAEDSPRFSVQSDQSLSSSVSMENLKNASSSSDRPPTPPKENEEEEMPKPNIVSLTRNVFENISTQVVPGSSSPRSKAVEPPLEPSKGSISPTKPADNTRISVNGSVNGPVLVNGTNRRPQSITSNDKDFNESKRPQSTLYSSKKSPAPSRPDSGGDVNANRPLDNAKTNGGVHIRTTIPSEPLKSQKEASVNQNNNSQAENKETKPSPNSAKKRRAPPTPTEKTSNESLDAKRGQNKNHVSTVQVKSPEAPRAPSPPAKEPVKESKKHDPQRPHLNLNELQPKKNLAERKDNNVHQTRPSKIVNRENKKNRKPDPSAGPGSLLIRPASNLVIGATKTEYLGLTQYNDIKTGEFAPAKKRPGYYDTYSDEEDDYEEVPVTNIDDYLHSDVPVTNIDDLDAEGLREGDASHHRSKVSKKWDFEGAGVCVGKSSLSKKTGQKLKLNITFNDEASSTFEYPSEQSLLETIPPQPGDFDHPETVRNMPPDSPDIEDMPDMDEPGSGLKATPGLGSGSLSSYQTKTSWDYQLGSQSYEDVKPAVTPPSRPEPVQSEPDSLKPSEEDTTWSETTSSDMLF